MVCAEVTLPNKLITEELGSSVKREKREEHEAGEGEEMNTQTAEQGAGWFLLTAR
jgi:hypothetical protein